MMESTVTANATPRPVYRIITVALGIAIVVLILTAITLFFTYKGSATSADLATQGKRRDCVTEYNADFTKVVRARDDVKLELDLQRYDADIKRAMGTPITQADVDLFVETRARVGVAQDAVQALPNLDVAVDHGFTLNGVRHPACPG